ncbi:MAG TPA: hypothetical protein VE779_17660 [Candidatus Angelobacter sp.]|jgi:hypothetical protein|nr:hypothetical protein [Candidatus Angelobacter sp.]
METDLSFELVPVAQVSSIKLETLQTNRLEARLIEEGALFAQIGRGPAKRSIAYEVRGLPSGEKVWIVRDDGKEMWNLMRETTCAEIEWLGQYSTVYKALQALSAKLT